MKSVFGYSYVVAVTVFDSEASPAQRNAPTQIVATRRSGFKPRFPLGSTLQTTKNLPKGNDSPFGLHTPPQTKQSQLVGAALRRDSF